MDDEPRRLGDRHISAGANRRILVTAIAIWVALVVGGGIVGYMWRGNSSGVVTGGLGAAAGAVVAWMLAWAFIVFVNVKRD